MAKVNKNVDVNEEVVSEEEVSATGSASVYKADKFVRAYTVEVHGKDYKKLAAEYAGKIGGIVK